MDFIKSSTLGIRSIADSITAVSERTPRKIGFWRRWILIPLWTIHFLLFIQGLFRVYLDRVVEDSWDLKEGEWMSLLDDIALCLCFVLEVLEVRAWRKTTLQPLFYLQSQLVKTSFFTYHLYRIFAGSYMRMCLKRELYCPELVIHVVQILSFHVGLGYAVYVWLLQRRNYSQMSKIEQDERWASLVPSGCVNSASHPRFDAPTVVKLVQWVQDDPVWLLRLPIRLQASASWSLFVLRYALACIPIIHLLALSERLPGEPPRKFTPDTPDLHEWDYPRVMIALPEVYKDIDTGESNGIALDEESSIEALSLRTIVEEDIGSAAESLDAEHSSVRTMNGVCGTSIDWRSLHMVDFKRENNRMRMAWIFARNASFGPLIFLVIIAILTLAIGPVVDRHSEPRAHGTFAMCTVPFFFGLWWTGVFVALPVPWILTKHFQGALLSTQARMFGMRGRPNLGEIERHILGQNCGRLHWSDDDELHSEDGEPMFTIVDTLSCKATTFHARRPPVMLFKDASDEDSGNLYACSFDLANRTFVEEVQISMDEVAAKSLPELETFRFSGLRPLP